LDSHKGIECEVCRCWFHAGCEELEDEEYIVLTRHTKARIHWYCKTCNEGSLEMLQMIRGLQDKISRVESDIDTLGKDNRGRMTQIESKMDKMNTEVDKEICKMRAEVNNEFEKMNSALGDLQSEFRNAKSDKPNFSDIVKQEIENSLTVSKSQIQEMNQKLNQTKLNLQEDQEKEARRNNTIIYRIPESDANSSEERKVTDNRFVLNLLAD